MDSEIANPLGDKVFQAGIFFLIGSGLGFGTIYADYLYKEKYSDNKEESTGFLPEILRNSVYATANSFLFCASTAFSIHRLFAWTPISQRRGSEQEILERSIYWRDGFRGWYSCLGWGLFSNFVKERMQNVSAVSGGKIGDKQLKDCYYKTNDEDSFKKCISKLLK